MNELIEDDCYKLPNVQDLLAKLAKRGKPTRGILLLRSVRGFQPALNRRGGSYNPRTEYRVAGYLETDIWGHGRTGPVSGGHGQNPFWN